MPDDGREATGDAAGTKGQPALREAALFGLYPKSGLRTQTTEWIALTIAGLCRSKAAELWSDFRWNAVETVR